MKTQKKLVTGKRKVLIVDDHPLLREGLARTVNRQDDMMTCGEAGTAQEALAVVAKLKPDIAVVDISLPGRDGLDLLKDLRARYPKLPVLILSMHDEAVYAERALRAGARGYLMKNEPPAAHIRAIRQVLAGEIAASHAVITRLAAKLSTKGSLSPVELLSDRELEIFRLFGEGRDRRQIAADLHLSIKTIETHRSNMYEKLGIRGASALLRQATHFVEDERRPAAR